MSRPRRGEGGEITPIYTYERQREILRLLKERGDKRSTSQIFCDCLESIHGSVLTSTYVPDVSLVDKYVDRATSRTLTEKEYKKQQMSWIEANMVEFQLLFKDASATKIYEELEKKVRQKKEEKKCQK